MKPDLSHLAIIVTGAGRGLGAHVATHLASCGAVVGVADIDPETSGLTAEKINADGGKAYSYAGDLSDQNTFLELADDFAEKCGRIDAIVNNAMHLHYCPVQEVTPEKLAIMVDIGVKAPFWSAQALLKHYDKEKGGQMINMSSPVVSRGFPNTSAYSTVKGAVTTFTKVMGAELGPQNIRVNAVSPASVPTPGSMGMVSQEEYEARAKWIPLRRIGTQEDNSNAIAFLLSEEASFINGEVLNVDGGVSSSA